MSHRTPPTGEVPKTKSVLVFIDGTICDTRHRHHLAGTPDFYRREETLKDTPVPGSVQCILELAHDYQLVYLGARPSTALSDTQEWLRTAEFPAGPIYLAETSEERLRLVTKLRSQFQFVAGIGDRWDDNECHLALGCLSIILKEFEGNWDTVRGHLLGGA